MKKILCVRGGSPCNNVACCRFFRKVYATFNHEVNIKEICWHLNNEKVQDQELATLVNKSIQLRIRPVNGLTAYKDVVRADLKLAAKLIHKLDVERSLYVPPQLAAKNSVVDSQVKPNGAQNVAAPLSSDPPPEKKERTLDLEDKKDQNEADVEWKREATEPKQEDPSGGPTDSSTATLASETQSATSKSTSVANSTSNTGTASSHPKPADVTKSLNPLLENITDYLIEEVSAEEEELLAGLAANDSASNKDGSGWCRKVCVVQFI